jgi:hypothetical protein
MNINKLSEKQVEATSNLVESPKDIVHCIYNHSAQVARFLVVKAPRPTMQSKLL